MELLYMHILLKFFHCGYIFENFTKWGIFFKICIFRKFHPVYSLLSWSHGWVLWISSKYFRTCLFNLGFIFGFFFFAFGELLLRHCFSQKKGFIAVWTYFSLTRSIVGRKVIVYASVKLLIWWLVVEVHDPSIGCVVSWIWPLWTRCAMKTLLSAVLVLSECGSIYIRYVCVEQYSTPSMTRVTS